jgi:hypothetical protein
MPVRAAKLTAVPTPASPAPPPATVDTAPLAAATRRK